MGLRGRGAAPGSANAKTAASDTATTATITAPPKPLVQQPTKYEKSSGDVNWMKSRAIMVGYTFCVFAAGMLLTDSNSATQSWQALNKQFDDSLASLGVSSSSQTSSIGPSKGWNPVHVYYGEPDDLGNKKWFAQVHQDEIIMKLLGSNGYFIDLAANDAVKLSNTLALERHGNWKGLCIEPNPAYWYGLAAHRTCDIAGALVGGPHMKNKPVEVKFRGVFGGIVGKLDEQLADRKKEPDSEVELRYAVPFPALLERFNVPETIDYLSLDVEGMEWDIMKNFPFDRYTIKVMTIERPSGKLKSLLQSHGYLFLKDLAWWGETLWAHQSTGLTPQHPDIKAIVTEGKRKKNRNKRKG